jgi:hypothetical protein
MADMMKFAADFLVLVLGGFMVAYFASKPDGRVAILIRRLSARLRKNNSGDAVVQIPCTTTVHVRRNELVFDPPLEVPSSSRITLRLSVHDAEGSP